MRATSWLLGFVTCTRVTRGFPVGGFVVMWIRSTPATVSITSQRINSACLSCLLLLLLWGLTGCASHVDRVVSVRNEFYAGRLEEARAQVQELREKHKSDQDVFDLDRAVIELCAGHPKESERILRRVRDDFDQYEQLSAKEIATSMLTDDTKIAYAGEDHEKILVRTFLVLSNLMSDGGDAHAYSLQIGEKQQELAEKSHQSIKEHTPEGGDLPEVPELPQVALGPYVQAMLHEESALDANEVVRAREMVVSYVPEFRDGQADLDRALGEATMAPGHGAIYVFTLVGRGPLKEESEDVPTQVALLIADQIISALGSQTLPPTLAPIKVAKVVRRPNRIQSVQVSVHGEHQGETATLVDVGQLAEAHYAARYHEILAHAVARRAIKKGAVYLAKEHLGADSQPALDLALTLGGIAWEATEAPDTRCWGLLPEKIQVLRVETPAGKQTLQLQAADGHGAFGSPETVQVEVHEQRNTYLLANVPDDHVVGEVLVSHQH